MTVRQLDTDDEQPENYEFPSLDFEASGVWQPRQSYDIATELINGSEVSYSYNFCYTIFRPCFQFYAKLDANSNLNCKFK